MLRIQRLVLFVIFSFILSSCQSLFLFPEPAARQYYYPPEYMTPRALVVSEHLATFPGGPQFLSTLISEETEVWMLSAIQENAEITKSFLAQRFGLEAQLLENLKVLPIQTQTVWARDWAPLFVASNAEASSFGVLDLNYYPDRPIDDEVPQHILTFINQNKAIEQPDLDYLPVNLELEGGNVLCTRDNCFVTEEVIERQILRQGNSSTAEEIQDQLEAYLDQEFWVVPRMPREGTGHIDIWAKFLNEKTLIIGEISEAALSQVPLEQAILYSEVKRFLDEQAAGFDIGGNPLPHSLGARVRELEPGVQILRVPMPTPGIYRGIETFRTYTNSILLDKKAIVPRYFSGSRSQFNGREQTTVDETEVEEIYRQAGYEVIWLRADQLIRDGGAWHCVSMQVPQSLKALQ